MGGAGPRRPNRSHLAARRNSSAPKASPPPARTEGGGRTGAKAPGRPPTTRTPRTGGRRPLTGPQAAHADRRGRTRHPVKRATEAPQTRDRAEARAGEGGPGRRGGEERHAEPTPATRRGATESRPGPAKPAGPTGERLSAGRRGLVRHFRDVAKMVCLPGRRGASPPY